LIGTSAPTTPSDTPRRQFLSPLAAMLRARYSTTAKSTIPQEEPPSSQTSSETRNPTTTSVDPVSVLDSATSSQEQIAQDNPRRQATASNADDSMTERGVPVHGNEEDVPSSQNKKSNGYGLGGTWASLPWLREKDKDRRDIADVKSRPEPPPPLHKVVN
jgi:cytoskeletal protein RodZ